MRGWTVALLSLALVATGCIGAEDGDDLEPASTDAETLELASGTPTEDELAARGLDAAPELRLGEWWNVTMTSELDGETRTGTVVVAGFQEGAYMVGQPTEAFSEDLVLLHLPPMGPVSPTSFGYEAHDLFFEPVTFPLTEGATWETSWYTGPVDAEVTDVTDGVVTVEMIGQNTRIELTYEPGLGLPASVTVEGYGSMEVTDHGFGYEGEVTVPWDHDLVLFHGRVAGALDPAMEPAPPLGSVEIDGDYDRASVGLVMGSVVAPGTPGLYQVTATTPGGQELASSHVAEPGNQGAYSITTFGVEDPVGTWEMRYVAGGAGVAVIEGMAYEAIQVSLAP